MRKPLLSSLPVLRYFKYQLDSQYLFTLWDISRWDPTLHHRWVCWSLSEFPKELEEEKRLFIFQLTGLAPLARGVKDKRGWGFRSGEYTSAQGYNLFSAFPNVPNSHLDLEKNLEF